MSLTSKVSHHSGDKELIPAETPLAVTVDPNLPSGYVQDEQGVLDNYAVEPAISPVHQPTPEILILLGLGAIAIFFSLMWIVSEVS
ncbi:MULTISPECIES: hypothetical protein [unclassified Synechocystis]|uniref:hypothetical protein n=1 Tax=unclassified Synechocystis TaxID=2640012 RepID=UPI00041ABE26|nr:MULTISPECIES: hypothetical protein [unclassified Synechocystis]AIE74172.1 hypothetical protein D082_16440 [Synechocystis sp. PCC 6714]MCT0252806.1 hypothetical protein [Synechocystis sp. CS-94]